MPRHGRETPARTVRKTFLQGVKAGGHSRICVVANKPIHTSVLYLHGFGVVNFSSFFLSISLCKTDVRTDTKPEIFSIFASSDTKFRRISKFDGERVLRLPKGSQNLGEILDFPIWAYEVVFNRFKGHPFSFNLCTVDQCANATRTGQFFCLLLLSSPQPRGSSVSPWDCTSNLVHLTWILARLYCCQSARHELHPSYKSCGN